MTSNSTTNDYPSVLRMAAPLMVSFVMRSAFTFVDTIYAATLGDAAVSAIGLAMPFEFVMIAIWVGLSTGLTSTLSRAMGANEGRKIEQYLQATWRLVLVASPLFFLLGASIWFIAPRVGLEREVYESFRVYGTVLICGSAFTAFWSVIPDSVVKAHQDTRSTMWAGIWSNVANLVLNTIFLFIFHWGIFGIALSTVIGRVAGLVYALNRAGYHERRRIAAGADVNLEPDPSPYRPILALAIPGSITFVLMAAETAVINVLLARLPNATPAIAAYSIYYRIMMLASMPMIAISVAMLPYAAKRIGVNDDKGLRAGLRQGFALAAVYVFAIVAPIMLLFGPTLAGWLTESQLTAEYTTFALQLTPLAALALTPFILCRPVFEAMGQGKPGLVMAIFRYVILTLPSAFIGMWVAGNIGYPELYGLLAGLLVAGFISSAVFYIWMRAALPSATKIAVADGPAEPTTMEIPSA